MSGLWEKLTTDPDIACLFSARDAFSHPVTLVIACIAGAALVAAPIARLLLLHAGVMSEKTSADVRTRTITWAFIAPAILVPIILCPASAMAVVCAMSLLCFREFARATGLFREHTLCAVVVIAIVALLLASLDHWYGLFTALSPLTMVAILAVSVLRDEPKGFIQRGALAVLGYLLFGAGLGHLGYMANAPNYRPALCLIIACVQLSDILAYICGKAFGKRKLFPNTSPNKTLGGHLGALLLTAPLAAYLAHMVFRETPFDRADRLIVFGLIVGVGGQLGDLVLGSIKRDLGIKDMAATLPGHGGFLDRFNSLLLVAPASFHWIGMHVGFGLDRPVRIFSHLW